ncbi:MAG: veratrol--corrinoid protein metyltransferase [Coriobacteriia bacterium]|nr:veratrol--corrinoid protein metyltransferase [Coriobacteriia bacterium]
MLTEKENYLRVVNGEMPEWVPRTGFASPGRSPATGMGGLSLFRGEVKLDDDGKMIGFKDMWGVEYVSTKETSNAALPVPDQFILDDITKWRDIIKVPDFPEDIDWVAQAAKDTENSDRTQTALSAGAGGFFLPLMNMMGFSEGLCAMAEEPEEVKALFDYILEFYLKIVDKLLNYYKPDLFSLSDDIAAAGNLFVSPQTYRDLVKPYHAALAKPFVDAGIPISMHCCGKSDDIVDDWVEIGVRIWNPAQVMNDLHHWKAKYKGVLALEGCFDSHGPANWPHAPEELVRQAVRDCIDNYAPDGGFVFWGSTYGDLDDPDTANKARWITEEYDAYGRTFYQ